MVCLFQIKEVRDFLMQHGFVYTFRRFRKKTGKDWAAARRGGSKIADILTAAAQSVERTEELEPYVWGSGFPDLAAWLQKIEQMYGQKFMKHFRGFVYFVRIKNTEEARM